MSRPVPNSNNSPKAFGWSTLIIALGTVVLAGLVIVCKQLNAPMEIVGTALVALGFGGRVVMVVGRLTPMVEASVTALCYSAVVFGALCFTDFTTAVIVAAVCLIVLLIIEAIDVHVTAGGS